MQALRRLFYRNRSITDGDGRHFIKRENGIERALAGADGLAVMHVHAAAVAWHVDYSAVLLIDKQFCRKCVPCIAVAGGFLTAFGILKRCFAINRVDKVIADRREQDFIDRCGFATYLNRLTGRQFNRAVIGLQLELEMPGTVGDGFGFSAVISYCCQVAEHNLCCTTGRNCVSVRHGFNILNGIIIRIFVIEIATADCALRIQADIAVCTIPVHIQQTGIRVFRAVERRTVLLFERVGDKVVVAIEQNRIRGDGHAACCVACANGMTDLIKTFGSANKVNIQVFNDLQHTITGWPGGKPNADDSTRPERAYPYPKRILIFSPHPDDDVISMGGTFARLVEQGHEVHVAYQTSGSIAVFDDYIYQQMDIATSFTKLVDGDLPAMENAFLQIKQAIANRKPGDEEARYLLQFKAALRRAEARGACRFIGVPEERVHFLNLPFYETGKVKKNPLSQADVDIIVDLLRKVQPHQIYAAGDLADPHGTHGVCLDAILRAYNIIDRDEWFKDCNTWWYRGAWMEWEVEKVDMAVPISPAELSIKRKAIYKHGSQNNGPAFPGDDPREFWQRAEDRNRNTADLYNRLGMAEYEAMEVFTRYKHDHGDSLK